MTPLDTLSADATQGLAELVTAAREGRWRDAVALRDALAPTFRALVEHARSVARTAGAQSHHAQATYAVHDVQLICRRRTVSQAEDTVLWSDAAGMVVHGWDAVSRTLAAIAAANDHVIDSTWLSGRMQWRRSSVIRDGAAIARIRLPHAAHGEELWLVAEIEHAPEVTQS